MTYGFPGQGGTRAGKNRHDAGFSSYRDTDVALGAARLVQGPDPGSRRNVIQGRKGIPKGKPRAGFPLRYKLYKNLNDFNIRRLREIYGVRIQDWRARLVCDDIDLLPRTAGFRRGSDASDLARIQKYDGPFGIYGDVGQEKVDDIRVQQL
jgi:hypothetical protein